MHKKVIVVVALVVLLAAGLAYAFWPKSQQVVVIGKPGENIVRDIDLKPGQQVVVKTEKGDMNIQPLIQTHLGDMVGGYFKLPEGPQRTKYLDDVIDQQEKAKKMVADMEKPSPTTGPSTQPTTQPTKVQIRMKGGPGMEQSLPPALRSQLAEFGAAIAKRRAERGLPAGQGIQIIKTETHTIEK